MRRPLLLLAALLIPAVVWGQEPASAGKALSAWTSAPPWGEEERSLEAILDRAVSRVSMPHAGVVLGHVSGARGYRLPGYGIVFVLTPRALPGERSVFIARREHSHPARDVVIERHVSPGEEPPPGLEDVEALERQVLILQHTAEAHRRAAEADTDRLVRDFRIRLEEEEPAPPPDAVFVRKEPGGSGTPPWRFWFESEAAAEERTPDRIVGDVKGAVLEVLETRGEMAGLSPDEFVTVAIDFVPGGFLASHQRPTRTLIVRARQRDLAARARGALGSEELRSRVEVIEY
jgi:hypothetical protein